MCGKGEKGVRATCVKKLVPVEVTLNEKGNEELAYARQYLVELPHLVAAAVKAGEEVTRTGEPQ